MKRLVENYTYNKTTGVITLTGVNIDRDQLLLIVNTTRNVTYYNLADSATTLQAFTQGANTSLTLNSSVVTASSEHANGDALTIYYDDQASTVTANVFGLDAANQENKAVPVCEPVDLSAQGIIIPVGIQSGTVTANVGALPNGVSFGTELAEGYDAYGGAPVQIVNNVTANEGGETPTSGTATLTNDTRSEINTEGFGYIALEIVSTGVTWSTNGVVAQAYNGTAPANVDIFAPAGIRYRHSSDTSVAPTTALNNIYYNLGIGPTVGNGYGTNLVRVDGSNSGSLVLPTHGTRYFLFDLTTSRFAIRPFFTAGTAVLKYRLYRGKHPFFSARNVVVTGDGTAGAVRVGGDVGVSGAIYVDGGFLEGGTIDYVSAIADGEGNTFGVDRNFPVDVQSGTVTANAGTGTFIISDRGTTGESTVASFTSTSSAVLKASNANRKLLTVFNEGIGTLFILLGSGTASTTNYSLRLLSGDYYELEKYTGEVTAIFGTAGNAKVTEIT
jgi:hypothetical protein